LERRKQELAAIALLAAIYLVTGKIGRGVAFVHFSASAVWPPTGIALAALLVYGEYLWPGILIGALLVNVWSRDSIWASAAMAAGNTLEAVLAAYLVNRFANGRRCFERARDTFRFGILAATISTALCATSGAAVLCLSGMSHWANYRATWMTWWLGDGVSDVVLAPLLILWIAGTRSRWTWTRLAEFVALLMSSILVSQFVFGPFALPGAKSYPLEYLCIPFLVWAAFRFGQCEAATVTLAVSLVATWGTVRGSGPFAFGKKSESLMLLQGFMAIAGVMTMALAAIFTERRRAEEQMLNLAVTDPLTGLANYRKLLDVLDLEIKRFGRTARPFALLLLDLDDLKKINDRYGHLTGSRALCRLADILRVHCRSIDTAARYGGDEFAVVIAEAGADEARHVALRICERIAHDGEQPPISASVGVAVYARDGITIEHLLATADRALYEMKRRNHQQKYPIEHRIPLQVVE
jgi:diguanylate cyclase (GGDEF)-like protein